MSWSIFIPRGAFILPICTRGKDMLQSSDIVFKSAAISRVSGISERQGYPSKAANLSFKSQIAESQHPTVMCLDPIR